MFGKNRWFEAMKILVFRGVVRIFFRDRWEKLNLATHILDNLVFFIFLFPNISFICFIFYIPFSVRQKKIEFNDFFKPKF